MEPFLNKKYKLDRCENLDELLDEMDVNAFIRKVASSISTTVQLLKKGDEYTLNTKMLILTTTQKFKLGEEKEVTTTDGRKVKNVFTVDGNVLTEKQIGDRTLTIVREFFDDGMIATSYYGNVVCKGYCLNVINRKIAKSMPSTTQLIKISECEYAINTIIPFTTHQQKFVPGEECNARTIDGRKIKNIFSIEGLKLIEQQIEPERRVTIVREFSEEEIIGEVVVGDIVCKYWCEAVE